MLDDNVYDFYLAVSETVQRDVEDILSDTLYKVLDILNRNINEE